MYVIYIIIIFDIYNEYPKILFVLNRSSRNHDNARNKFELFVNNFVAGMIHII